MTSSAQSTTTTLRSLRLVQRLLALAMAVATAFAVLQFPIAQVVIGAALLVYAVALYRFPSAWLMVLPALLPVVDLAIWSGRFFFNEFDFLAMTTLAVLYWRRPTGRILPGIFARPYLPVTLLALSYAASLTVSLYPLPVIDMNSFATYLSPYNALRVARGFFWAWLLMPFLLWELEKDQEKAKLRLMAGFGIGLTLAGICVLWERSVFVDLLWGKNIYALLGGFLDFTGSYRVTGMFSGMNVGDTAIDGYLSLAVPLSLYPVIYGKSPWTKLAGLFVFTLGGYSIVVTFSRGLYAAFGLSLIIIAVTHILGQRRKLAANFIETILLLTGFALATGLLFYLYMTGGYEALGLGAAAVVGSAFIASRLTTDDLKILLTLWISGALVVAALIHRAISHHKWSTTDPQLALGLSIAAALLLFALPAFAARKKARGLSLSSAIIAALLLGIFWMGVIPPLSGVRVLSRFSTTTEDLGTRETHWQESLAAMQDDWQHRILGMGVGSFPRYFISSQIGKLPIASYRFEGNPGKTYMTLGAGDFNMIQRISLKPDTLYALKFDLKTTAQTGGITIKLCHKHILYSERYVPDCKEASLRLKSPDQWQTQRVLINSGPLGRYGVFYWPTTFMLQNGGSSTIQITNISLVAPDGTNLIRNGDFSASGDFWFLISDFEHLAWHAKNMFLHLYFEHGLVGLVFFIFLNVMAIIRLAINHQSGDRTAIFWVASLSAFLMVGLFGTSIDMPRVAALFYLILFASLAPPRVFSPKME